MARPQHISDVTITEALVAIGEATAAEVAERLGMGQSTAAKRLAVLEGAGSVRRQPGGRVNGTRMADRWSVAAAPAAGPTPTAEPDGTDTTDDSTDASSAEATAPDPTRPGTGSERLGRGALGGLVRDYLAAHPGEDLGPTQVGKALGRSQGAVSNALARLEAAGEARLVSVTPRRYRIVS
jgi:DNA-binding MarR family transcriptional regulator